MGIWGRIGDHTNGLVQRFEALDLFKFWVLFLMIEGHLFRACLIPGIRLGRWFVIHEIIHGVVASGFLFSAGFAAYLSFYNKRESYQKLDRAFFKRVRRILFVILMGYWIHLPFMSLHKTLSAISAGKAVDFFRVDILQCIGMALLIFTFLTVILKKEKWIVIASLILMMAFFLLTDVVRHFSVWAVIDPYFRYDYNYRISLFPLFPWAGFLFFGVLMAFVYARVRKDLFFKAILILGFAFFPWFFFQGKVIKTELTLSGNLNKAAIILLLLWICQLMVKKWRGPIVSILQRAGKESLFVYVLHLFIIFNRFFSPVPGVGFKWANSLNLAQALGLFLLIQFIVFASSYFYGYFKERQYFLWRVTLLIFWIGFSVVFAAMPY